MGCSAQNKGYKIWDTNSLTLVVSRDVTFDESSIKKTIVQLPTTDDNKINVVVPGGERKNEVDNDIHLTTDTPGNTANENSDNSENKFVGAQDSPEPQLRRSSRKRQKPWE